jgi:hypothetical protein
MREDAGIHIPGRFPFRFVAAVARSFLPWRSSQWDLEILPEGVAAIQEWRMLRRHLFNLLILKE